MAATFKCGTEIVRPGMTTMDVLLRCGPPSFKELKRVITEGTYGRRSPYGPPRGRGGYSEVTETVETWHYNCGAHRFIKILTFRGGLLDRVRVGRYGSGEGEVRPARCVDPVSPAGRPPLSREPPSQESGLGASCGPGNRSQGRRARAGCPSRRKSCPGHSPEPLSGLESRDCSASGDETPNDGCVAPQPGQTDLARH